MVSKVLLAVILGAKLALAATSVAKPPFSTIEPTASSILAAAPSATPLSPTSNVKGQAFDRIVQIWLENTVREA